MTSLLICLLIAVSVGFVLVVVFDRAAYEAGDALFVAIVLNSIGIILMMASLVLED